MKKFVVLAAALFAFTGLVGVSGSASAAPSAYPGTVSCKIGSVTGVPSRVKHRTTLHIKVVVTAAVGNARPAGGSVRLWIFRNGLRQVLTARVSNGVAHLAPTLWARGNFTLRFNYLPSRFGVWKTCSTTRYVHSY